MNKTLTIDIYQDPTAHIDQFLMDWQDFGHHQQSADLSYELISHQQHKSVLTMHHDKLTISGHIPSETFLIIDRLAKACEADKIIEGEVIDGHPGRSGTNTQGFHQSFGNKNSHFKSAFNVNGLPNISKLSKAKLILLLILAIPVLLIAIPIMIVVAIIKIITFKLSSR